MLLLTSLPFDGHSSWKVSYVFSGRKSRQVLISFKTVISSLLHCSISAGRVDLGGENSNHVFILVRDVSSSLSSFLWEASCASMLHRCMKLFMQGKLFLSRIKYGFSHR